MTLESAQETAERLAKEAEGGLRDLTASPGKRVELLPCPFCGVLPKQVTPTGRPFHPTNGCLLEYMDAWLPNLATAAGHAAWNRRAPQWQPIETAPKDQSIDLWETRRYPNCRWLPAWNGFGYSVTGSTVRDFDIVKNPTHWMPKPTPPTGTTQDAAGSMP